MALELKLNQKLSQSLVMTPQLQQAIKLLQLGRHDYLEMLSKELLENPVLEDAREGDNDAASPSKDDSKQNDSSDSGDNLKTDSEEPSFDAVKEEKVDFESLTPAEWEMFDGASSDSYQSGSSRATNTLEDDNRYSVEATVSNPEGLVTHLLWQVRTSELGSDEQDIAGHLIGNLDRNGYLDSSVEEIAQECKTSVETVEKVLEVIQSFDPPGIAARNLRECLMIQMSQLGLKNCLAWKLVCDHLHDLELRRYDAIARELKLPLDEVYNAIKVIQKLEPRPGRPFADESPVYITPDIYVRKVGSQYAISLNESGMPRLRVNKQYQEMLANGKLGDAPNKEYVQDRVKAAAWLIKSIHQRQQTIYRVTECIMKFQHEFLEHGVTALKPLVLRDIASQVEMHESTVSRVTTNKFVHTPQGVFELKFFFTSGLQSGAGSVSSESVKDRIKCLIAEENPKKPLSDQAIVDQLKSEGIDIARRTVAKYREMMGILSSSRRKKLF